MSDAYRTEAKEASPVLLIGEGTGSPQHPRSDATITIKPPFVCQACRGIGRRLHVLGPLDIIYPKCDVCKGRGTNKRIDTVAWMELWRARVGYEWTNPPKSICRGRVTTWGIKLSARSHFREGRLASHSAAGTLGG